MGGKARTTVCIRRYRTRSFSRATAFVGGCAPSSSCARGALLPRDDPPIDPLLDRCPRTRLPRSSCRLPSPRSAIIWFATFRAREISHAARLPRARAPGEHATQGASNLLRLHDQRLNVKAKKGPLGGRSTHTLRRRRPRFSRARDGRPRSGCLQPNPVVCCVCGEQCVCVGGPPPPLRGTPRAPK